MNLHEKDEQMTQQPPTLRSAPSKQRRLFSRLALIISGALALWWLGSPQLMGKLEELFTWISALGPWGMLIYVALYVLSALLFVPGSALTLAAGMLYGLGDGFVLVSASSMLGAAAAFGVARRWRERFSGWRARYPWLIALERAVSQSPLKLTLITRLSPLFPYNLLNYALGLTPMSWRSYLVASWLGMLPGTLLYVYLGTQLRSLSGLGARPIGAQERAFQIFGLIITLLTTLWIARSSKKQLDAMLRETTTSTDQP